jgi:hypothetical protein
MNGHNKFAIDKRRYASAMKDPRVLFRKLSIVLPVSRFNVLENEIQRLAIHAKYISILDLGAGSASYWNQVLSKFPNIEFNLVLMDAVPNLSSASMLNNVRQTRLQGEIPIDLSIVPDNSYDIVVAFDLIEHLPKDKGYLLLYEIDRIAGQTSVIFTPNGFVWQPPSLNNPFNAHISGWTPRELKKLGWNRIKGHTGFRSFQGPYGLSKDWVKGEVLLEVSALLKVLTWKFAGSAFAFTATKRSKNPRVLEQEF